MNYIILPPILAISFLGARGIYGGILTRVKGYREDNRMILIVTESVKTDLPYFNTINPSTLMFLPLIDIENSISLSGVKQANTINGLRLPNQIEYE